MTPEEKRAYNREYYLKNRENEKARAAKWREENPRQLKEQSRRATKRYQEDAEYRAKRLQWGRESEARRKDSIKEYEKMRNKRDRKKLAAYQKQYREENAEALSAQKLEWERQDKLKHPDKYRVKGAVSRKSRRLRAVSWADKKIMERVYEIARIISEDTGEEWHVDHIIPLQGRKISGLHVQNNLQILEGEDNRRKSNRRWQVHVPKSHLW